MSAVDACEKNNGSVGKGLLRYFKSQVTHYLRQTLELLDNKNLTKAINATNASQGATAPNSTKATNATRSTQLSETTKAPTAMTANNFSAHFPISRHHEEAHFHEKSTPQHHLNRHYV